MAQSKDSDSLLQEIIDRLCGQLDCKEIQPGGSCFDPNTLLDHASYVIDLNYHTNGECDINYATPAINDPCKLLYHFCYLVRNLVKYIKIL